MALAAVHPVLAERLVDARPAHATEREPQEEVPVLVHLQRLVEAAGIHDGRATQHHGDGMGEVAEQEAPADVALLARPALMRERHAVVVDHVPAGVDQSDVRPRVQHRHLPRQLARPEAIVGVEQRDEFPARRSQAGVARGRRPAVILAQDPDAVAVAREHRRDVPSPEPSSATSTSSVTPSCASALSSACAR